MQLCRIQLLFIINSIFFLILHLRLYSTQMESAYFLPLLTPYPSQFPHRSTFLRISPKNKIYPIFLRTNSSSAYLYPFSFSSWLSHSIFQVHTISVCCPSFSLQYSLLSKSLLYISLLSNYLSIPIWFVLNFRLHYQHIT